MKYWAYVNNEILGPFEKGKLLELPSFSPSLLVCPQTPVGEKTEDWKEASTYPELSALIGQGGMSHAASAPETFAPPPSHQETHAPAAEAIAQPAPETHSSFKPLRASQSVEPVPPAEHASGGINISVNRLGKAGADPAAVSQPHQASASFDPISLSRIERRSETLSQNADPAPVQPAPAASEGITLEPPRAFSQPAEQLPPVIPVTELPSFTPAAEPVSFTPAAETPSFTPAAAPVIENFSRPSAAPVVDVAGLENLVQRLDALSKASVTRQDISSAVDPLRMKLDQMGEVISSIKNSQFQREVMDKLNYLENAVGELKTAFRNPPPQAAAPALAAFSPQKVEIEKNSDTVFGVQPVKQAEKPKPEPAKETAKPAEIKDEGSKPSRVGPALKKMFKFAVTMVLLAAVLVGAVIGLKTFGIFDATKFIPFPLPFMGGAPQAQQAVETPAVAEGQTQTPTQAQPATPVNLEPVNATARPDEKEIPPTTPAEQEALRKALLAKAMGGASQGTMPDDLVPEIIYITRTFKLKPAGESLENKIYDNAGKAGGNFNRTGWEVRPAAGGLYEIAAIIPTKMGNLTYTFTVDRAKKSVQPSNKEGKAVFEALSTDAPAKPPKKAGKKGALKQAAKQPAKKAAAKKQAAPEEEYEYEYVEDDGTGAE